MNCFKNKLNLILAYKPFLFPSINKVICYRIQCLLIKQNIAAQKALKL